MHELLKHTQKIDFLCMNELFICPIKDFFLLLTIDQNWLKD